MKIGTLLIAAAMVPAVAFAEEQGDTIVMRNGQRVIVTQEEDLTSVSLYGRDGNELTKVSETKFVDGKEVEQVYVSSPFIPRAVRRAKCHWESHYPLFFFGNSQLAGSIGGMSGNDAMHGRGSKSWEWGMTLTSLSLPFSYSWALTSALSIGQVHHHFQGNYVLSTKDGLSSMVKKYEDVRKSYISYNVIRIPLMLEWQKRAGGRYVFCSVGPSLEWRWKDYSRYFVDKSKFTETSDINMNPIGVNMELHVGYGCLLLYGRAALTPLLKSSVAPKCYPVSIGLGLML